MKSPAETGRDLLFLGLASQLDLIDDRQVTEVLAARDTAPAETIGATLVARGVLSAEDRAAVDRAVERHVTRHAGDIHAAVREVLPDTLRQSLSALPETVLRRTMSFVTPPPVGHVLIQSVDNRGEGSTRYTLTRLHARGGLGQVWLARDMRLGREVAFKELRPETPADSQLWSRFLKEARITGQLEHPGIVPVYELSNRPEGGQPFYTMRFVRGKTLREAISAYHAKRNRGQAGPLDRQALLTAFLGVANAVAYAHSRGVIHRDLKGDNVVLGDYGEVIVLDWGLAKVVGDSDESTASTRLAPEDARGADQTVQGEVMGTPAYMAPEQAAGRLDQVNELSDVYGLGAILFEILTGRPPFTGKNTVELLRLVTQGDVPRPRTIVADTPPPLEAICLKALKRRPSDRYRRASALAEDVRRFLADEPVSAYPEPFTRRAGRWARRHKPLVAGMAALLVTVVVALSVGTLLLSRKQKEIELQRGRAEQNFTLARQAVDRYLTRVSDSPDLKAHGLETLRRQLLDTARGFYEKLAEHGANAPELRDDLGAALISLGNISRTMAENDKSEEEYKRSIEIYDDLLKADPNNSHYRVQLANGLGDLGLMYSEINRRKDAEAAFLRSFQVRNAGKGRRSADDLAGESNGQESLGIMYQDMGRAADAEAMYRRAEKTREQLVREHPNVSEYQKYLAMIHVNLGVLYAKTNRLADAERHLKAGIPIIEVLVKRNPAEPEYRNVLAGCFGNLAGTYMLMNRLDDSGAAYKQEMEQRETLARTHPLVLEYVLFLGSGYTNLGELETRAKRPAAGLPWFDKAIDTLRTVLAREQRHATGRFYLSYTYSWRAQALGALGRYKEAVADWDRAIEFDDQHNADLKKGRAEAAAKTQS